MNPTRHTVHLIAAAASTLVTLVLFQSVAMLAGPWPSTPAAKSQAASPARATSMERS